MLSSSSSSISSSSTQPPSSASGTSLSRSCPSSSSGSSPSGVSPLAKASASAAACASARASSLRVGRYGLANCYLWSITSTDSPLLRHQVRAIACSIQRTDNVTRTHLCATPSCSSLSALSSAIPCNVFPTPSGLSHPAPNLRIFAFLIATVFSSARSMLRAVRTGIGVSIRWY